MKRGFTLFLIAFLCLFALAPGLSATQYKYPISGNTGNPADEQILIVDTESKEFADRVTWISERAGLLPPKVRDYLNHSPLALDNGTIDPKGTVSVTVFGQACWSKNDQSTCVDVRAIATGPEGPAHCLVWLNLALGLGKDTAALGRLRYEPPRPPPPVEDWQAPGSPMGEPLPNQPGRYKSRSLGYKVGDTWKGPSGATYQLANIGGVFQYLAWLKQ